FRRHFALWRKAMDELGLAADAEVPLRWVATWRRLRKWLSKYAPEVDATLRGPADAVALTALQDFVGGGPVAPVVAGLWRICDGQDAPLEQGLADELRMPVLCSDDVSWWRGIFGGYAVYDYEISTVLLPLQAALKLTRILRKSLHPLRNLHPNKVAFACSFNFSKILLVDVGDGSVHVWTRRSSPLLEAAVPEGRPLGEGDWEPGGGLLRWVEEYTRRLELGIYRVEPLRPRMPASACGISLFPASGSALSVGCFRGVEVTGSCVYMPEHPQGWSYCISLRLTGSAEERGFETCQLQSRHWNIQE
ncbi:unnamed protein product, partial [Polarella glacialis]